MTMAAKGLAKLIEECGEVIQVAGKKLAYYTTDEHPDGGPPLTARLQDECADVIAAIEFVAQQFGFLHDDAFDARTTRKLKLFHEWHEATDNNTTAIDARNEESTNG